MIQLVDRVVAITGAGRGLGRAYALEAGRLGAKVVVNDAAVAGDGVPRAQQVVDEIEAGGGTALLSCHDIMTPEGAVGLIDRTVAAFGRIDGLVNNAGFLRPALVADISEPQMQELTAVHLYAAFRTVRAAWPHMRAQGFGRIVLTGSGSSFGHEGNSVYSAMKAAMIGMTRSLALEGAGWNCRVNCVLPHAQSMLSIENPLPGVSATETGELMALLQSRRTPRSVAPLAAYLLSDECAVNGEAISALGGLFARVVYGTSRGWVSERPDETTADDLAANLAQIMDTSEWVTPLSVGDEMRLAFDRFRADALLGS
ncbi:SDR family NAD(P)-dependent oxidoreductase [Microbacterium sp. BWT-B31]|uniref:SDR family NAD(P)-dependent oxidoreductase n=1 Tax=Microbacterium sp. BWT-B31 TaxID=3232072 RepID=UPI003528310C